MMALLTTLFMPIAAKVLGATEFGMSTQTVLLGLGGLECVCLAIIGDYVGRFAIQANGCKPYIVRYVRRGEPSHA